MKSFSNIVGSFFRVCAIIGSGFVFLLMLWGTAGIIIRSLLDYEIPALYEAASLILVVLVYLGIPLTQFEGKNIRIDILVRRMSGRKKAVYELLATVISLAISVLFTWRVGIEASISFKGKEFQPGIFTFPVWPSKIAIFIGFVFLCLCLIIQVWWSLQAVRYPVVDEQATTDSVEKTI
jgi:TRAP-type C4-dicarboxylate transport system permease small subunit